MEEYAQPQTIGYKLLECLGQGLNSRVYKALREDSGLNISQPVAIKILNSENLVEIWKKEFLSLSKVRSPHCVSVLGFDWIDRQPALVLELVEGLTLAELTRQTQLQKEEIIEIGVQVRRGLEDLAQVGLSHGDLSLNNIMINEQGCVLLLDFGLANFSESQTQTTIEFAAPEVLAGEKPTFETDMFALRQILQRLSQDPDLNWETEVSTAGRREGLAEKISEIRSRVQQSPQTAVLTRSSGPQKRIAAVRIVALFLLLMCGFTLRGEALPDVRPSILTIRADRWILVQINGKSVGYAPFESRSVSAGKVSIDFRHSRGAGHRTLTIRKGQHIVLGNSFFGL